MKAGYARLLVRVLPENESVSTGGIHVAIASRHKGDRETVRRGEVVSVGWPDEKWGKRKETYGKGEWETVPHCPISVGDIVTFVESVFNGEAHPETIKAPAVVVDGEALLVVLQLECRVIE